MYPEIFWEYCLYLWEISIYIYHLWRYLPLFFWSQSLGVDTASAVSKSCLLCCCIEVHTLYSDCFAVVILLGIVVSVIYCCLSYIFCIRPCRLHDFFTSPFLDIAKISVSTNSFFVRIDPEVFFLQSFYFTSDLNDFNNFRVNHHHSSVGSI